VYRRLPDSVKTFRQEILHDGPNCKFSLLILPEGSEPLNVGEVQLEPGGAILWYLFPDRSYEVGRPVCSTKRIWRRHWRPGRSPARRPDR